MTLRKRYFIWKIVKESDRFYSHPNTLLAKREKWADKVTLVEYDYHNDSGWYLGHIEWDDTVVAGSTILEHAEDFNRYTFQTRTPAEVITLLNSIYPPAEGDNDYFSLDDDGFSIIDEKPIEGVEYL